MKHLLYTGIIFLFVAGCSSPEKLLQQGRYDALIEKSVKKILKGKKVGEYADLMDKSYKLANQRDNERIRYLKKEGNPDTWDEILSLYSRLKYRQDMVRKVVPLKLGSRTIDYEFINYDSEIAEAKHNAADYYYAHGKKLMENNDKESFRQAYSELIRAKSYSGGTYADIDRLIDDARYFGTTRVLVTSVNNSYAQLPRDFMDNLLTFNRSGLNTEWVEFYFRQQDNDIAYDFYIDIHLISADVSRGVTGETDHVYTKRVQDGFEYVLDRRGNVMKDSAGNDIRIPKYKDLRCTVIEKTKEKTVELKGEIEFSSTNPDRIISRDPIAARAVFQDVSYRAIGDLEVLNPEQRQLLQDREVPFPDDLSMIYNAAEALKNSIAEVIRQYRSNIR